MRGPLKKRGEFLRRVAARKQRRAATQQQVEAANRRERLRAFAQHLADVLDQGEDLGFDAGQIEGVVTATEKARSTYFGLDAPDAVTKRVGRVLSLLHWARSIVNEPFHEKVRQSVEAAAHSVMSGLTRGDTGLEAISHDEWCASIRTFGALPVDLKGWAKIVFELLRRHDLTNARSSRNMADAYHRAIKRSRPIKPEP